MAAHLCLQAQRGVTARPANRSLPRSYIASPLQQVLTDEKLRNMGQRQQQEPPGEDSFEVPQARTSILRTVTPQSAYGVVDPGVAAMSGTSDKGWHSHGFQSRKEALDAYYQAKQSAAALANQPSAAQEVEPAGAVSEPPQTTLASLVTTASSVSGSISGAIARRVSLLLPEQVKHQPMADAFSPGRPGLKSQLSKMMEEVAQARSEVQNVQSQLSDRSRPGQRHGSISSSVAGSDHAGM